MPSKHPGWSSTMHINRVGESRKPRADKPSDCKPVNVDVAHHLGLICIVSYFQYSV